MPLKFKSQKTNGVYSKIFINKASRMLIKINTTPFAHMEEESEHFIDKVSIREATVLQKIGFHPNIITPKFISLRGPPNDCTVFLPTSKDGESPPSQACLAIGMELGVVLERKKKGLVVTNSEIATFLHHVAFGLVYAHGCDIAHRDIKPDNIIKTSDGFYQLIDWGLAGLAPSEKQSDSKRYVTRWYRPPELLDQETEQSDHRAADIWALAITMLEIFFNPSQLFANAVRPQLFTAIHLSKQTPSQIQTFFRGAPVAGGLADLLSQMLTRDPSLRISAENIISHPFVSQYTAYAPPCLPSFSFNFNSTRLSKGAIPLVIREKMYEWLCNLWAYYPTNIRTIVLFTAYEICDRYSRVVGVEHLPAYQTIGCASMAIADSLYDTWSLSHEDYVTVSGNFFTIADLEQTIYSISKTLEWNLYTPGVYTQWKSRVRDSDNIQSVVALAAAIADRKKYKWSSLKIVGASLQKLRIPKRFTLFRRLLAAEQKPSLSPLIF